MRGMCSQGVVDAVLQHGAVLDNGGPLPCSVRIIHRNVRETTFTRVFSPSNQHLGLHTTHCVCCWGMLDTSCLRWTYCRGELYPCETTVRLCDELKTGESAEVDGVSSHDVVAHGCGWGRGVGQSRQVC